MFTTGRLFAAVVIVAGVVSVWGESMGRAPHGRGAVDRVSAAQVRAAVARFDSLLAHGSPQALELARALTTGPARRLFPLLAETRRSLVDVLDTARSRDTILDVQVADTWAVAKVRADAVFTRPFLGMTSLTSVQAVHLYRDSGAAAMGSDGWAIADFEELPDAAAPVSPRTGAAPVQASGDDDSPVPVSRLAPARADHARATRLRLRVTRRDGSPLTVVTSPSQRIASGAGASPASRDPRDPSAARAAPEAATLVLDVRRAALPDPEDSGRVAARPALPDSLARHLASTPELDLTDKLLRTRAASLSEGSPDDVETARRVWRFVSTSFDYRLGATLFATSREAIRDLKGDCSEASILTAALLRAAGIPARVMLGYASLGQGVWIGHAWVEAWLGGADGGEGGWVGVDAALREFPAGPHRVALLALSGREDMKTAATNLMLSTLNNLDIGIEGAWAGAREIPLVEHPAARAEARKFLDEVLEGMGR